MLRIKGLRNVMGDRAKDRFNEDAKTETNSIRDSIAPKKRTLSHYMRVS
jgi:hypothetical protein